MGNPILATISHPIKSDDVSTLPAIIQDMIDTMRAAKGVGLAAPQIGLNIRVLVFEIPASRQTDSDRETPIGPQVLINPRIIQFSEEVEFEWEGCLSIPGLRGEVPRYSSIEYDAIDAEGNNLRRNAFGFHARVVQHELDHLDGILYPERMSNLRQFGFVDELEEN